MMASRCVTTQYNGSMHRLQTWNNLLLPVFASLVHLLEYQIFLKFIVYQIQTTLTHTPFIYGILYGFKNSMRSFQSSYHFETLIPFWNCYKIEMTYFIYNWKFSRCMYAYESEQPTTILLDGICDHRVLLTVCMY